MREGTRRAGLFVAKLASFGVACGATWTLSLPLYVDAVLALGLLAVTLRAQAANVALLAIAAAGCVGALSAGFLVAGEQIPVFYRAHERYARPGFVYEPNVDVIIEQPHGDLLAIDPFAEPAIREPRSIRFRTDPAGYRNPDPYSGQRFVLVGDSFVVGNGNDESETLRSILFDEHGVDAYSLAFPADPSVYERKAAGFVHAMGSRATFLFLVFEGNDFVTSHTEPVLPVRRLVLPRAVGETLDRYDEARALWLRDFVGGLAHPPRMLAMARLVERRFALRGTSSIAVRRVGPRRLGFHRSYNVAAVDPEPTLRLDLDPEVTARTACVFFVPTKLRVYAFALEPEVRERLSWPAPGLQALEDAFSPHGIPVVDLTDPLVAAAESGLPRGEYVFWRDDTHWNGRGMRAVAPAIAACAGERTPERDSAKASDPAHAPARSRQAS